MKGIIRKTILGIWFFGGLSACTSKPHFTIEGSLDEKVDGEAYIVGYPGWNKKPDTLARAEIRDGKFTLTGSLPDWISASRPKALSPSTASSTPSRRNIAPMRRSKA